MSRDSRSEKRVERYNAKLQKLLEKGHILTTLTEYAMIKAILRNNAHNPRVIYKITDELLKNRSKIVVVVEEVE